MTGNFTKNETERLQELLLSMPLDLEKPPVLRDEFNSYMTFYNINFPDILHHFGSLGINGFTVAVHVFAPGAADTVDKTVFVIHGYLLHSAAFPQLYRRLLQSGYTVVCFDLPGHGLSSGRRAHIDSFSVYADVLRGIIRELTPSLPPLHGLMGTSTGSSVIFEYLTSGESGFAFHVLVAPLVRSAKYRTSKIAVRLFGRFFKSVPTRVSDTTSDREKHDFIYRKDPLKIKRMPLTWAHALFAWNRKIKKQGAAVNSRVMVIQGDRDCVVDWRYNLRFLAARVPGLTVRRIAGGKHELFCEASSSREEVFRAIMSFLGK